MKTTNTKKHGVAKKRKQIEERIEWLQSEIASYQDSINLLNAAFFDIEKYKNSYAPRKVKFTCIPRSEKLFRFTLHNITQQLALLERELEILQEFVV